MGLRMGGLNAAVEDVLDMLSEAQYDIGGHFTCSEAEKVADLFRHMGRDEDAEAWLKAHGAEDDEGDSHCQGDDDEDEED